MKTNENHLLLTNREWQYVGIADNLFYSYFGSMLMVTKCYGQNSISDYQIILHFGDLDNSSIHPYYHDLVTNKLEHSNVTIELDETNHCLVMYTKRS